MSFRDRIEINRSDIDWAAERGLLTQEQVEPLWNQLRVRQQGDTLRQPRFSSETVSYYLGTAIISLGMLWLLYMAWEGQWEGWIVMGIASCYVAALAYSGHYLWYHANQKRLGGLLLTTATWIVPIAMYGLQYQLGLWYRPDGVNPAYYDPISFIDTKKELLNVLPMELSASVSAMIALKSYPFPFLTTVPMLIIWYIAYSWGQNLLWYDAGSLINLAYGLFCVVAAYGLERNIASDGPDWFFWLYFIGAIIFWTGMSFNDFAWQSEWHRFFICFANVGLIFVAVALKRHVFMVLGAFGVFMYALHLNDLFGGYVLFPFIVTAIGGIVVGWGLFRNRMSYDESMTQLLIDSENQENPGDLNLQAIGVEGNEGDRAQQNDGEPLSRADIEEPSA